MTTNTINPINDPHSGEQNLIQDLVDEVIQICGIDVSYIIRDMLSRDYLFGESPMSEFKDAIKIEMELMSIKSFGGDGDLLSRFGIEHTDNATFRVSSRRFKDECASTKINKPREGDLIYLPTGDSLWEIRYVKNDENFQRFGKNYTYRLECNLFQYSGENIETGDSDIDEFSSLMTVSDETTNSLLKTLLPNQDNFNEESDFIKEDVLPIEKFDPNDPFNEGS
jgi:hypothetical protein